MRIITAVRRVGLLYLALAAVVPLQFLATTAVAQTPLYSIQELPFIPVSINDAGDVVGYQNDLATNEYHAFYLHNGVTTDLGKLPGTADCFPIKINNHGQILGTCSDSQQAYHPFLWQAGSMTEITPPSGSSGILPHDLNDQGLVVGEFDDIDHYVHPFKWYSGNFVDLSQPNAPGGAALSVNNAGQIVGWVGGPLVCFWNTKPVTTLGPLPGFGFWASYGEHINQLGDVSGWSYGYPQRATLWQNGSIIDLGVYPGIDNQYTYATSGINNVGQIIGYGTDVTEKAITFIWQNGKMRDLTQLASFGSDLQGFGVNGINSRGQIVGDFYDSVRSHYVVLTPIGTVLSDHAGNLGTFSTQIVYPGLPAGTSTSVKLTMAGQPDIVGQHAMVFEDDGFKTSVLHASFDLTSAKPGKWTLVVDAPNVPTISLNEIFTVEEARVPQIGVQVTGRDKTRGGYPTAYQVIVSNSGNSDAVDVPIWIATTDTAAQIIPDSTVLTPPAIAGLSVNWSTYPLSVNTGTQKMLPVVVPRVPPGSTVTLTFRVNFANLDNHEVRAWASPLYRQLLPNLSTDPVKASLQEIGRQVYAAATGDPLLSSTDADLINAATVALNQLGVVRDRAYQNNAVLDSPSSLTWMVEQEVLLLANYKGRSLNSGALINAIAIVFSQLAAIAPDSFGTEAFLNRPVQVGSSDDPNHATGPVSAVPDIAPGNWVPGDGALGYAVYFENKSTAQYPAQKVTVVEYLDPAAIDLSSLSLGTIALPGGSAVPVSGISPVSSSADGSPSAGDYNADVLLAASQSHPHALIVHVRASLDPNTSRLTWVFTCARQDGQPLGIGEGFLAAGEEGSVSFQIRSNHAHGISNPEHYARVYFDVDQAGLETLPHWFNTVDNQSPVSAIAPVTYKRSHPDVPLSWSGSDQGISTNVRDYTIYVRDGGDGKPYVPWLKNTTQTSATFTGIGGHTYYFMCLARDWAGNVEVKSAPDTASSIVPAAYLLPLTPNPVPGSLSVTGTVTINIPAPAGGTVIPLTNTNTAAKFSNGTNAMSITIPEGQMQSAPFTMTTSAVSLNTSGTVSAKFKGYTKNTTLIVRPIGPASVSFDTGTIHSQATATGAVTLEAPAGPGDVTVSLKSSNTAVLTVPATVVVPKGSISATFIAQAKTPSSTTSVKVTASGAGVSYFTTLKVLANTVATLTLSPTTVQGGTESTATITLDAPAIVNTTATLNTSVSSVAWFANAGGTTITSVVIPAGQQSVNVRVRTAAVPAVKLVTLKATVAGMYKTAVLTVKP